MDLLKKTIVLSGEKEGYCSVVRVGNDLGVKVVGEKFDDTLFAGVKLGERTVVFPLTGDKTEMEYADLDVRETDAIGCIVLAEDKIVSRGGVPVKPSEVRQKEKEPPVYSSAGEKEGRANRRQSRISVNRRRICPAPFRIFLLTGLSHKSGGKTTDSRAAMAQSAHVQILSFCIAKLVTVN